MSQPCAIETCKWKSRALCHCCSKNLCLEHLKEHQDLTNSQLNPLGDEINTLRNEVLILNVDEIISNCRQKLDQWRDDCYKTINTLYEEKCQELQQRCFERIDKRRKQIDQMRAKINNLIREQDATHEDISSLKSTINDIKRDVIQFEEKGIIVDVRPLIINKGLIYIEESTLNEIDVSTLSSPFRKVDCSNVDWPVMTSSNRFLLLDQYPNLYLFDLDLSVIKQSPWKYSRIPDMCCSSTLNHFIIITDQDGLFMVDENLTSIESIQTIEKKKWLSCTCSDASLYLTINEYGSNIFQFSLLSSFQLIKQWNPPQSCQSKELIHNIAYSNGTLVLILSCHLENTVHIELRSLSGIDRLWSVPLDIARTMGRINRVCSLKYNEWLIIDYESSRFFQIGKDGKLKVTQKSEPTPHNGVLFGSNILSIRTTNSVDFYRV